MKLPYLFNPLYRAARLLTPEKIKLTVRGLYNAVNKYATYGHSDIFTALDIETNSRCNLRCGTVAKPTDWTTPFTKKYKKTPGSKT